LEENVSSIVKVGNSEG